MTRITGTFNYDTYTETINPTDDATTIQDSPTTNFDGYVLWIKKNVIKRVDKHETYHKERDRRLLTIIGILIAILHFIIETIKWAYNLLTSR